MIRPPPTSTLTAKLFPYTTLFRSRAGSRQPRAQLATTRQQRCQHHRAAVRLQFNHILAGIRMRRGKGEQQTVVDKLAVGISESAIGNTARMWRAIAQRVGNAQRVRAGDAHDAHASSATASTEERRVGEACVSPCRSRWSPETSKTNNTT